MTKKEQFDSEAMKIFWILFTPIFFCFFIYIIHSTNGFKYPENTGWFYSYQSLASGFLALLGGFFAYSGVKLQIKHDIKIRQKEKNDSVVTLMYLSLHIYALTIEIHRLLRDGRLSEYENTKDDIKEKYQLPRIFRDDNYVSALGPEQASLIFNFRNAYDAAYAHLFEDCDTNTPLVKTYEVLNEVYIRFNYAFNINFKSDLETLWETRKAILDGL